MIIYNVERRWFEKKADAEAYRKQLCLKKAALGVIELKVREDACALLNALCAPSIATPGHIPAVVEADAPLPIVYADVEVPDCIPAFLLNKDGTRRV